MQLWVDLHRLKIFCKILGPIHYNVKIALLKYVLNKTLGGHGHERVACLMCYFVLV